MSELNYIKIMNLQHSQPHHKTSNTNIFDMPLFSTFIIISNVSSTIDQLRSLYNKS